MEMENHFTNNKNNTTLLYNSHICRLCGVKGSNGYPLFKNNDVKNDLCIYINKYFPIKICDDGKYPRWICGACHLQVDATVNFFQLIINGQKTLNELYQSEIDVELMLVKKSIKVNNNENKLLENREKQKSLLITGNEKRNFSKNINTKTQQISLLRNVKKPIDHQQQKRTTESTENTPQTELIKKKRGRPFKQNQNSILSSNNGMINKIDKLNENPSLNQQELLSNDKNDSNEHNENIRKRRRAIKLPVRYRNDACGREYEKVYHDMDMREEMNTNSDEDNFIKMNYDIEDDDNDEEGFIGFVQNENGDSLGDLFLIQNIPNDLNENRKRVKQKNSKTVHNNGSHIKRKTLFVCDVCQISFSQENKFFEHRLLHKNVCFECKECLKTFTNKNLLIEHQRNENHSDAGVIEEYFCNNVSKERNTILESIQENESSIALCNMTLSNSSFIVHNFINHSPQVINTEEIQLENNNEIILSQLLPMVNNDNKNLSSKCPESKKVIKSFSDNINQSSDLQLPETRNFKCKICNDSKIFKNYSSLNYHIRNKHNEGIFVCRKCSKQFKSKLSLKNHQLMHSTKKPYKCQDCEKEFKIKSTLIDHRSLHTGDKKFSCEKCGKQFAYKRSLSWHKNEHEDKQFKCDQCGKRFMRMSNMQEHYRIHTDERPYQCSICYKKFRTSSQCKVHIKRHKNEFPFKCTTCDKHFITNYELLLHLRRHNNIKPFTCNDCDKSFVNLQSLKTHSRIHTGEKPYKCRVCAKRFSDYSNFGRHRKIHLNKKRLDLELLREQESQPSEYELRNINDIDSYSEHSLDH